MPKPSWIVCASFAACVVVAGCSQAAGGGKRGQTDGPVAPAIVWQKSAENVERAPISLTASDGSGLALTSLAVKGVIEAPLAFTELHLTFHNPEPRRREGRFEITLPKEAAISRFALRVGDAFQEGEVVERRRAQQVYEDFLHRRQDPALLEKDAGNEFAARVFPIEPNADKEIIIAYSQELARGDQPYEVLLQGLPKLAELKVDVQVGSNTGSGLESSVRARGAAAQLHLAERDYVPAANLEVRVPAQKPMALRNGSLVVARVAPVLAQTQARFEGLTVLFDTSASRALGFGAQIERLAALLSELGKRAGKPVDVRVVAFDQTAEELYRGPADGFGLRDKAKLLARDALGASDVVQALGFVAEQGNTHERVLLVGDGVITAGAEGATALREAVTRLAAHGVRRLDVLAEGGIQDRSTLLLLTRAGLPQAGVVMEASAPVAQLATKLLSAAVERVDVKITGATWTYPSALEAVQPGDERLVFAEVPEGTPVQIELVGAGAEAFDTLEVPRPLLARAVARAKIEAQSAAWRALPETAGAERARLEQAIVRLSTEQRVVSDFTALLVLESAEDYRRYGIEQRALTGILRVGKEGVELFDRTTRALPMIAKDEDFEKGRAAPSAGSRQEREAVDDLLADVTVEERAAPPATAEPSAIAGAVREQRAAPPAAPGPAEAKRESSNAQTLGRARAASAVSQSFADRDAVPRPSAPALRKASAAPREEAASDKPARSSASDLGALAGLEAAAPGALEGASVQPRGGGGVSTGYGTGARAEAVPAIASSGAQPPARVAEVAAPAPLTARASVQLTAANGLAAAQASSVLRNSFASRARQCYRQATPRETAERLTFELALSDKGDVVAANIIGGALAERAIQTCIVAALRGLQFPKPEAGRANLQGSVELSLQAAPVQVAATRPQPSAASSARPAPAAKVARPSIDEAYTGVLAEVLKALAAADTAGALRLASAARAEDPGDVIALIALGEVLEAQREFDRAARVYGSLIDLFPSRADLRRMAGGRLERLPLAQQALAVDTYRRAVAQRPDHPAGHRSLAYALWKHGQRSEAFETLERALDRPFNAQGRFPQVDRILREDLALIGAAWVQAEPAVAARVENSLRARGLTIDRKASTRFVLSWETDANDVDFHLYDGRGGHAYYMQKQLGSGGALYADITTGYGPECFAIPGRATAYPYVLQAHYFSRGPMGYGMGKVQVVEHDGRGGLRFEEHPFVIMKDKAFAELGRVERPLSG